MAGPFSSYRSKGERNNNQGNIEDGPYARSQPGYVGSDGRFARFANPDQGNQAQVNLIQNGARYKGKPISGIIMAYAPPKSAGGDNTDEQVRNYIGYVAARTGLNPDGPINAADYPKVAAAMREFETGKRPGGVKVTPYGGSIGGSAMAGNSGPDVTQIQATPTEQARMGQNDYTVQNPFDPALVDNIRGRVDTMVARGDAADQVLGNVINTLQTVQDSRVAELQKAADTKHALNDEIRARTTNLAERLAPIFQRREAIVNRQNELVNMNPLERLFRGAFDPNYNDVQLRAELQATGAQADELTTQYQTLTNLQNTLLKLVDSDAGANLDVLNAQQANANEDFQLASQSYTLAQSLLTGATAGLDNQMTLIRQQATASANTLGQMTIGEVNSALEQAQNGNGYAIVNGIRISAGQLKQQQDSHRDAQMSLESRALALESGRLGLAEQYEDQLISKMSDADVDAAVKNGGVYQGQQLSVSKLGSEWGRRQQLQAARVENIANDSAAGTVKLLTRSITNSVLATNQRMQSMIGQLPQEQQQLMHTVSAQFQGLLDEWNKADAQGLGKQWAAQNVGRFQKIQDQQTQIIDQVAERWAGGNKELKPLAKGWLTGTPINATTSAQGLIAMARNGMPAGTRFTGPALAAFNRVKQLVSAEDSGGQQEGESIDAFRARQSRSLLRGKDKASADRELVATVTREVGKIYSTQLSNQIVQATPAIARKILVNGKAHPFSFVDGSVFADAYAAGQDAASRTKGTAGEKNTAMMRTLLDALDANTDLTQFGTTGSKAYLDLINRGEFSQQVQQTARQYSAQHGFGDFLLTQMGGVEVSTDMETLRTSLNKVNAIRNRDVLRARTAEAQSMRGDPVKRAQMILGAMEGINTDEASTLLNAVRPLVQASQGGHFIAGARGATSAEGVAEMRGDQFARYEWIIRNHKFDNPQLESIRRRASQQWTPMTNIVDRMFSAATGGN